MNHYTYLLQSKENDMMYIGVRSCEVSPEVDNYWGSSKHLPKNVSEICDKFILGTFNTRQDAVADEIRRHNINDVVISDVFWNKAKQTSVGFDTTGTTWNMGKDAIEKIRQANIGKKMSATTKSKISKSKSGKKLSKEHSQNISNALKDRVFTDEWKQNMSEAQKDNKHIQKQVRCIETDEVFNTIKEATKAVGLISPTHIGRVCSGKAKSAGGHTWEFVKEVS